MRNAWSLRKTHSPPYNVIQTLKVNVLRASSSAHLYSAWEQIDGTYVTNIRLGFNFNRTVTIYDELKKIAFTLTTCNLLRETFILLHAVSGTTITLSDQIMKPYRRL